MIDASGNAFITPHCPAFECEGKPQAKNILDPSCFSIYQQDESDRSGDPFIDKDGQHIVEVAAAFSGSRDGIHTKLQD